MALTLIRTRDWMNPSASQSLQLGKGRRVWNFETGHKYQTLDTTPTDRTYTPA